MRPVTLQDDLELHTIHHGPSAVRLSTEFVTQQSSAARPMNGLAAYDPLAEIPLGLSLTVGRIVPWQAGGC